jgi:hypothetical protein
MTSPLFQPLRMNLRPPRVVIVFDGSEGWPSHAARGLYECGQVWGGSGFLLVPHHAGEVATGVRRLARAYDPDYVVALETTIGQFEAVHPGVLPIRVDGRLLEGREREEFIAQVADDRFDDSQARRARESLARDCTPHRLWIGEQLHRESNDLEHVYTLETSGSGPFHPRLPRPCALLCQRGCTA